MKSPNKTATLNNVLYQLWTILTIVLVITNSLDAIRVYEGTNIPGPTTKITKISGLSKKSSLISKRSWNPIDENSKSLKLNKRSDGKYKDFHKRTSENEMPALYKIKFSDKHLMQYLRYIIEIPRLEEYTFCMWYKPTNLSHDQTIFFYSLNKNEILLRFWINAYDSTLRLAIRENVVYKVPANIRENKWHHICQSWNGVLGEIQVFLDGKRIGAGVISHYKGTYIPEGGEVTLGQDLLKFGKKINDGLEGELFGFNLVDEAVPHDQANFLNSQYKPKVQSVVPPFKKLPPIKKTYQEIKAYISSLPSETPEGRKKNEALSGVEPNVIKKTKEVAHHKRTRGSHRVRYPPLRKVVVYNRDDRQLHEDEDMIELNRTKPVQSVKSRTRIEITKNETQPTKQPETSPNQVFDENYSIHSYRFSEQKPKTTNYEIYEVVEDDKEPEDPGQLTDLELLQRKARQNFNLFTAREANKVYTLSSSVKDLKKPKFHFETESQETNPTPQKSGRRSFEVEETRVVETPAEKKSENKLPGIIPVYETESRRKRSAEDERQSRQFIPDDPLVDSNGFRRLPKIPDSFINLFSKNASKTELEEKLEEFFPGSDAKHQSNILAAITEVPKDFLPVVVPHNQQAEEKLIQQRSDESEETVLDVTEAPVINVPEFSPMPASIVKETEYRNVLGTNTPARDHYEEFNPKKPFNGVDVSLRLGESQGITANRRKFDVSAGMDLIMRSYGGCSADRGSPVQDVEHLIISWANTPVRIFGGAMVEGARNECGNF